MVYSLFNITLWDHPSLYKIETIKMLPRLGEI
jgi:hypothetical protein